MSIRSDVGVAIKKEVLAKLSKATLKFLKTADETNVIKDKELAGTLFVFRNYKWNRAVGLSADIDRLYAELFKVAKTLKSTSDYKIIEACFDYPESDENDMGCWDDNPWNLRKAVSVSLEFEAS